MSEIKVDALSTVSGSGSLTVSNNLTASGVVGVNGGTGGQVATNFSSASTMGMKINDTNSGNLGGMLGFYSGSGAGTLRANIQNANNAGVHFSVGTGGSIVFTQNGYTAANALDDYEEGTWTPAWNVAPSGTTTSLAGQYTKIGRLVYLQFQASGSNFSIGSYARVQGLPFAATDDSDSGTYIIGSIVQRGHGWISIIGGTTQLYFSSTGTVSSPTHISASAVYKV